MSKYYYDAPQIYGKLIIFPGVMASDKSGIIGLLGYCKGGNFNSHIWAWFGQEGKSGSFYLVKS